jgi:4-hydroxythreonine-4-phosphate dehydrogenase
MGCPVGIGPEIILRYFQTGNDKRRFDTVVIGDIATLRRNAAHFGIEIDCVPWQPGEILPDTGIPVYSVTDLRQDLLSWGRPTLETGHAMVNYIETAVHMAQQGDIDGITTCPISKIALQRAGYAYPGHTEMLAALTGENRFTMMMAGPTLRVTLVTIHCSFKTIPEILSTESVLQRIRITYESLLGDFALLNPKIAVAGLNPHAGEEGIFGSEEAQVILPAVQQARQKGIDAQGPFPPDTVFIKAAAGEFDAVVCMYHDQGLIPFKLLHFSDGVNVTIGLAIVRTSVDHGTAYDIAGQGTAKADSLAAAVVMAAEIAKNRKKISNITFS